MGKDSPAGRGGAIEREPCQGLPFVGVVALGNVKPTPGMASVPRSYEPPVFHATVNVAKLVSQAIRNRGIHPAQPGGV